MLIIIINIYLLYLYNIYYRYYNYIIIINNADGKEKMSAKIIMSSFRGRKTIFLPKMLLTATSRITVLFFFCCASAF